MKISTMACKYQGIATTTAFGIGILSINEKKNHTKPDDTAYKISDTLR